MSIRLRPTDVVEATKLGVAVAVDAAILGESEVKTEGGTGGELRGSTERFANVVGSSIGALVCSLITVRATK